MKTSHEQLIVAIVVAAAAGIAAALGLIGLAAFAAAAVGALCLWRLFEQPASALKICFFLLLVAQIKFRWRDPGAALSSNIDGQVMFELLMYGVVLFITLVNFVVILKDPLRPSRNEAMLLLYVALALLSVFWSVARNITLVRAAQLAILYLFCFCAVRRFGPTEMLRTFGLTLFFSVLLLAAMAVTLPFANGTRVAHELTQFSWDDRARFTWFAVQPISAGAQTGAAIIFLYCTANYSRGGWKTRLLNVPLWVYLLPLLLILAATRARGPLFATLAAMLVISLRRHARLRLLSWTALFAVLVTMLVALNVNTNIFTQPGDLADNPNPIVKFLLRGQTASEFISITGRGELWHAEALLFSARPILGYGYIASRDVLLNVLPWAGEAHNALGETALDLGLVGILIFWAPLLVSFFQSLLRRDPYHEDWTSAAVAGFLAFMLIDGISETGFSGVVSYLSVMLFATMFAHRDGWGRTVQGRIDRSENYAVDRAEPRRRAWALQWPTGGAL
jgi:O-antigen ligase